MENRETKQTEQQGPVILYGTNWCPGAILARRHFEAQDVDYEWVDIDADEDGRAFVLEQTGGYASVPTLRLPDGEVLVEPSIGEIKRRFGSGDHAGGASFLDRLASIFGG